MDPIPKTKNKKIHDTKVLLPRTPSLITGPASSGSRPDRITMRVESGWCDPTFHGFSKKQNKRTTSAHTYSNISKSAKIKHMFSTFSAKMFIQLVLPKPSILVWQDLWAHHLSFFPWCGDRHATHLRQDGRWRVEKSTSISRSAAFHVFEGSVQSFAFGGVHEDLSRISKAHKWTSLDRCFSTFFYSFSHEGA